MVRERGGEGEGDVLRQARVGELLGARMTGMRMRTPVGTAWSLGAISWAARSKAANATAHVRTRPWRECMRTSYGMGSATER